MEAGGTGRGAEVVDVVEVVVLDATAWTLFSVRVEYIAAVTAAPEAALTAAMMARVVLDIVKAVRIHGGVVQFVLYERCWRLMSAYDRGRRAWKSWVLRSLGPMRDSVLEYPRRAESCALKSWSQRNLAR